MCTRSTRLDVQGGCEHFYGATAFGPPQGQPALQRHSIQGLNAAIVVYTPTGLCNLRLYLTGTDLVIYFVCIYKNEGGMSLAS